jgi:hypothetical protein
VPKPATKTTQSFSKLNAFLDANPNLDLRSADLFDDDTIASLSWKGIGKHRDEVLSQLRAYQRLVRLLGAPDRVLVLGLMARGIGSALQIAAMPRPRFFASCSDLFAGDADTMQRIYQDALARRSALLLTYIHTRQSLEPHAVRITHTIKG